MISFKRKRSDDDGGDASLSEINNSTSHTEYPPPPPPPPPSLSSKYGIGAKLLMKMGYVPGSGLGTGGSGIVDPIATSAHPKGVGIGMMSSMNRNMGFGDDHYGMSSDEEEPEQRKRPLFEKPVTFSTDVKLLKSAKEQELELVRQRLKDLHYDHDEKDITLDTLPKWKILILNLTKKIKNQERYQEKLSGLEKREGEKRTQLKLVESVILYFSQEIDQGSKQIDFIPLIERVLESKSLTYFEMDKYLAEIVGFYFQSDNVNLEYLLEPDNMLLTKLNQLIDIVSYYPGFDNFMGRDESNELCYVQTVIYSLVFGVFEDVFANMSVVDNFSLIVTLILDYELILRFINVFDYVTAQYLTPKLINEFKDCDILADRKLLEYCKDLDILVSPPTREVLIDFIKDKFKSYLQDWYHRDDIFLSRKDILLIKQNVYNNDESSFLQDVASCDFLQKFITQVYYKYFDLQQDLLDGETKFVTYFVSCLFQWDMLVSDKHMDVILSHCFNEIKKVLLDWYSCKKEAFESEGVKWYVWVKSLFPRDNEKCNIEFLQIDSWLDNKDESLTWEENSDIMDELFGSEKNTEHGVKEGYLAKPLNTTFKETFEQYCEENDLSVAKSNTNETVTLRGSQKKELHLLYVVQHLDPDFSTKKIKCFIKFDTLWVQTGNSDYDKKPLDELLDMFI